jgi:integrase
MAREKRGSGSFRKLTNGTFEYTINTESGFDEFGKRQRKSFYGKTQAECRKKHKEWLKDGEPTNTSHENTLAEWLELWLFVYKKGNVSEGTYEDYVGLAKHVINHRIGKLKLSQVKPIHITEFLGSKADYSYSFHKRMRFILTSSFECAIDNDLCIKNPAKRAASVKKVEPQREAFLEEDVRKILEFTKTDELFGLPIYIMFHTGIRSQEMRALTIEQIDFKTGIITIDRAVKRNGEMGLPKNNKTRYIPLKPEIAEYLNSKLDKDSRYIIGNDHYVTKSGFESRYKWFFDRLNRSLEQLIDPKSPHAIRHTAATMWQKNGMPISMVAALLGHHSTTVTDKYTHVGDVTTLSQAVNDFGLSE